MSKNLQFVVIKLEHAMSCDLLMMYEMEKSDTFQERTNKKWGDNFFFVMRRRPTTTKAIYNQMNLKKCDKRHTVTKCVLLYCNQKAKENSPVRQVHTFEQFGQ